MGKHGLRTVAELCYHKAHYAAQRIAEIDGFRILSTWPFFKEFVVQCPTSPTEINRKLMERNILGGLDVSEKISNGMLLCVTEMNSQEDIDALVAALREFK
jgi:glycine dehydrogenase subunit 1